MSRRAIMGNHEILKDKTLALFFTCGVSLKTWHDMGMIDREVAIYNELSKYFKHIYFFTYGGEEDIKFGDYLADNITVIPKEKVQNSLMYSFLIPFIHHKIMKNVDITKTNQMWGSWSAVGAKLIHRKKLLVRTGFMLSLSFSRQEPPSRLKQGINKCIERLAYKAAEGVITSSRRNLNYVEQKYHPRNHVLIPNYVETDVFRPLDKSKKKGTICFVGRLSKEKNIFALLEALSDLPYTIDIIGSGPLRDQLLEAAGRNRINANFLGNIPNHNLPEILNEHELFILPSLWENMPKALLEAMACGLPVIGTNVDGIKEVVRQGEDGILCEIDPGSIKKAIVNVMENEELKQKLGTSARKTIEERFSLDKLIEKELELYMQLLEPLAKSGVGVDFLAVDGCEDLL